MSTQLEQELQVTTTTQLDEGDHERFTHIVLEGYTPKKGDFVPLGNSVVEGIVNSSAVTALCGKVWVPGRDPQKYPKVWAGRSPAADAESTRYRHG